MTISISNINFFQTSVFCAAFIFFDTFLMKFMKNNFRNEIMLWDTDVPLVLTGKNLRKM